MDFSKLPLATGSATALLGLVILLFILGKIVPRSQLDDVRSDLKKAEEDRDKRLEQKDKEINLWQSAYLNEVGVTRELSSQNSQLMEFGRTADRVLRSLPTGNGDTPSDGSSSGVVPRP